MHTYKFSINIIYNCLFNSFLSDEYNMNDGNSAGEGQIGQSSASPAVFSDRRSNYSGTTQVILLSLFFK